MKFSYNWLKDLTKTDKTAEEIAELFLTHSFEVEGIEDFVKGLNKVVVGKVLDIKKHPNADRLSVAKVDVGKKNGGELQIVCGAPNLKIGQKVPVALVGAKLPDGDDFFEIKKSKIRGVESNGMICAEDELGIGDNHEGIMVLSSPLAKADTDETWIGEEEPTVGQNFKEYLQLDDKILDIDILPNRAHDCLGYNGVAQELNAVTNNKKQTIAKSRRISDLKLPVSNNDDLDIDIKTENCERYIGVKMKNIKIKPSPLWMQMRLRISGIKPINNVVDITNYVMLETGQPLHAFDARNVESLDKKSRIVIRQAKENEEIKLLDEQELKLSKNDIVIADENKVLALAGIMGGLSSGIKNDTKEIILEGANFKSSFIRFTMRRHNLQSEAGYRFERDIDPNFAEPAILRALELLADLTGGEIETVKDVYPKPIKSWNIDLDLNYVNRLLGTELKKEEVRDILERLGIIVSQPQIDTDLTQDSKKNVDNKLSCLIPTRRRDLRIPEDLIEEVGRIYGYDKIKPQPLSEVVQTPHKNKQRFFEREIKDIIRHCGFDEVRGYSFYSKKNARALGLDEKNHLSLMNPMNPNQALVRQTLAGGILDACQKSLSYFDRVRLFDVGKVYIPQEEKQLPKEKLVLTMAVAEKGEKGEQFFVLKEALEKLFEEINLRDWHYDDKFLTEKENNKKKEGLFGGFHPVRRAVIKTNEGLLVGMIGEMNKRALKHFGIKNFRVAVAEIDIDTLLSELKEELIYKKLTKFPSVERDLSVIVEEQTRVADVANTIFEAGEKLIEDVKLFDLYVNPETGERSMAFRLTFSHPKRTLKAKEVDKQIEKIIKVLEEEMNVILKK